MKYVMELIRPVTVVVNWTEIFYGVAEWAAIIFKYCII